MIPKLLSSLQNKFKKVQEGVSCMLLSSQPFHMPKRYLTSVKHRPAGEGRAVGSLWARHLQSTDIASPCNSRTCICRHISRVLLCVGQIPPQALLLLHSLGSKCQVVHQEQSDGPIPFRVFGYTSYLFTQVKQGLKVLCLLLVIYDA